MKQAQELLNSLFTIASNDELEAVALKVFRFQHEHNRVYQRFCRELGVEAGDARGLADIPFLPIEVFKQQTVYASTDPPRQVFTSSGTTGSEPSRHHVASLDLYEKSFFTCFRRFYGEPSDYCILSLLPDYLERQGSSLVYMARRLMEESAHPEGGFYLDQLDALAGKLRHLAEREEKVLLLGVSFALLDLASLHPMPLPNAIVMETGGMKGRRREMVRQELHDTLCRAFGQEVIHSEYGMTELLSQAYSHGSGLFSCPPWMKVLLRDTTDPLSGVEEGQTGGINVVDLANTFSCSFIATQDLGRLRPGGQFEVLGRFDNSDVRGCNLLAG